MHLSKRYNIRGSNKRKISIFLPKLKQTKRSISTVPIEMETNASRILLFFFFSGSGFSIDILFSVVPVRWEEAGWFHLISSGKICSSYFSFSFSDLLEITKLLFLLHLMMSLMSPSQALVCRVFEVSFICLRNASARKEICWNDDNKISRIAIKSKHLRLARSANTRDKNQTSICFSSRNCRIRNDGNKIILRSLNLVLHEKVSAPLLHDFEDEVWNLHTTQIYRPARWIRAL